MQFHTSTDDHTIDLEFINSGNLILYILIITLGMEFIIGMSNDVLTGVRRIYSIS